MSSISDLTDFDDESDVPISSKKNTRSKAKNEEDTESGYRIRGALKVPRATSYTCQSLYEQIFASDIDLQAEYQRAVVWPDAKQVGLIDSIFRNFYVPPVIFVLNSLDDGSERRVCVDGKQRLTSIYRFIAGEIPYKDALTNEKFIFKDTGSIKAKLLPEKYRKIFLNKQIVCMEYQDITPANEREIFQRVQLGMALTPAEKLQAITGPHADFIRDLLNKYVSDQLASYISWDTSRANDFRGFAMAVYVIFKWPHLTTLPSLSVIEAWLHEPDELDDDFQEDINNTYEIFVDLAKDSNHNKAFRLPGVKMVAPVEVLGSAVLIHVNKKRMTMTQLSEAIKCMRKHIRESEKDIRLNSRMMKTILDFLKKLKVSDIQADPNAPVASRPTVKKRKRIVASSDDEEEIPAPALRTPAAASSTKSQSKSASSQKPPIVLPPPVPERALPTGPAALRTQSATLPPRPTVPAPPQMLRQNSLGDKVMARTALHPGSNVAPQSQDYDPRRDPRHAAYQGQSHPGSPWLRR